MTEAMGTLMQQRCQRIGNLGGRLLYGKHRVLSVVTTGGGRRSAGHGPDCLLGAGPRAVLHRARPGLRRAQHAEPVELHETRCELS
jgi:hypothetical protein